MHPQLVPFLAVVAIITLTPGPDTALVVRNTVQRGARDGLLTAAGCATGLLLWGTAAALGIAVLLTESAYLFGMVKLAGAAYLVLLGVAMLWSARSSRTALVEVRAASSSSSMPPRATLFVFGEGLLADLLNPKAAVFFTALLPQFANPEHDGIVTVLAFAIVTAFASLIGLGAYSLLAMRVRAVFAGARVRRWLDAITGATLVALGLRVLAAERR
jgi:threonine/homoserine/homoserine lactone efflux protein